MNGSRVTIRRAAPEPMPKEGGRKQAPLAAGSRERIGLSLRLREPREATGEERRVGPKPELLIVSAGGRYSGDHTSETWKNPALLPQTLPGAFGNQRFNKRNNL